MGDNGPESYMSRVFVIQGMHVLFKKKNFSSQSTTVDLDLFGLVSVILLTNIITFL
jgi:hypothetical protein